MTTKIDLSNLELREVEIIAEKPKILTLDINKITKIDKLSSQTQLQQLSIAHNQIIQINGLTNLINLTVLNLSNNKIISIDGIKHLSMLTWLNLSNNKIKTIEHLDGNCQLKHVDLSDNLITKISNISYLTKLKTFLLHGNRVASIEKIGNLVSKTIEILSLAENNLHDLTEIGYLHPLFNLRQFSIKGNPCLMKSVSASDIHFDYRPFIINWCVDLKILDGEEVNEKEKLVAEWLFTQGKGRQFKPGQHFELVEYLTRDCAFTNLKNKNKLKNDLDNILEQRKRLLFRKKHSFRSSHTTVSTDDNSDYSSVRTTNMSNKFEDTDLNHSISDHFDSGLTTNTSMLMSESSFLPMSPVKPNTELPNPLKAQSPTIIRKSSSISPSDAPTLKFSKEIPGRNAKNSTKSTVNTSYTVCNSESYGSVNSNREYCLIPNTKNSKSKSSNLPGLQTNNNNNNAPFTPNGLIVPLESVIKIQAWWRSVLTRMKNPIVKRYLTNRGSHRIKSHILFLQKQMQLYYESYEQQRKLNATQNHAIQFLLDKVKELAMWQVKMGETSNFNNTKPNPQVLRNTGSQCSSVIDTNEKVELLSKIEDLEDQISTLKDSVWRLEQTMHQYDDRSKICESSHNMSESSYSEEADLNRVILEVEKIYENGSSKRSANESETDGDDGATSEDELQTLKTANDTVIANHNNTANNNDDPVNEE